MNRTQSLITLVALVGASLFTLAWASHRSPQPIAQSEKGKRTPVVVELFTSEGCSSCPPADAVLARLKRDQPVDGAEVIALSEHVDYWNYIGWADPFSAKEFSARQSGYARALNLDQVYTPQAVINGHAEFVGSDQGRAEQEIARAARTPKAEVHLTRDTSAAGDVALRVQIDKAPRFARVERWMSCWQSRKTTCTATWPVAKTPGAGWTMWPWCGSYAASAPSPHSLSQPTCR